MEAIARYSVSTLPPHIKNEPVVGIYAIRNTVSGKAYIGSTVHIPRRFRAHLSQLRRGIHRTGPLQAAWAKYGEPSFEFLVLEIVPPDIDLGERENAAFALYMPAYNISITSAPRPMLGRKHRPESIEKMRQNRRGKGVGRSSGPFSAERRAKISAAKMGRPGRRGWKMSPEARAKLSAAHTGMKMSDESRAKLSAALRGKPKPEGHGKKVGDAQRGKPKIMPPWKSRKGLAGGSNPMASAVIIDGQVFETCSAAARHFGIHQASITYWLHIGKAKYADGRPPPEMKYRYRLDDAGNVISPRPRPASLPGETKDERRKRLAREHQRRYRAAAASLKTEQPAADTAG